LDPQRRFTIPSQWFEQMGKPANVYVMRSLKPKRKCLDVFAQTDLDTRMARVRNRSMVDTRAMDFHREVSELTVLIPVDVQNRIRLPDDMLAYAGLEGDIALLGTDSFFEIWALQSRPRVADDVEARVENLSNSAAEWGL